MEFSTTQKGNKSLVYQGYEYSKFRENESQVITWRCRVYFSTKCKAFLKPQKEIIIGDVPHHCHDSNPQKIQANKLKAKMKEDMKSVGATPRNVIGNILTNADKNVLEQLPKPSSLTRTLTRHKQGAYIPNPTTVEFNIPEHYTDVILHDTGADDPDRILAIGNEELVKELKKDVIFGDGTFDKAPNVFYQLYTWHAKVGNSFPPCIYFLLQKKNIETYSRMFTILCELVPDLSPDQILVDFEKACMSAARVAFPQAEVKGCYFHLTQSVIRKNNSVGLKQVYESDVNLKLKLKSLPALSFVPIADVRIIFNQLAATFPDEDGYNEVLTYFYSTYIEGAAGRLPQFPIRIWNHHEAAAEKCPKTTNCCEGFHNALNSIFHCSHPSIWNLLDGLRRDIACQRLLLANTNVGRLETKNKKYKTLSNQVAIVVQGYQHEENKLEFLRRMANLQ